MTMIKHHFPYRSRAIVLEDEKPKPRWRIIKREVGSFRSLYFRYVVQKRLWIFWFEYNWFADLNQALEYINYKTAKPAKINKAKPVIVWNDVDGKYNEKC